MRDGGVSISIGEKKLLPGAFRAETTKRSLRQCGPADVRKTRWDPVLQQQLTGPPLLPLPDYKGSNLFAGWGLKSRPLVSPDPHPVLRGRAWVVRLPSRVAPYTGGGRSAGGRCRSRARGGTESSQ